MAVNGSTGGISTVSFSILINGSPMGFFRSSKGLRQGDPLSPYLFVLGMEAFSLLIHSTTSRGYLPGFKVVGRNGGMEQITHLLFADDTMVFCRDSKEHLAYLNLIFLRFEVFSRLKINLEKSSIMLMGNGVNLDDLALELGCRTGTLPTTYLGLPLGMRHNATEVWDGVEERFRKKLAL